MLPPSLGVSSLDLGPLTAVSGPLFVLWAGNDRARLTNTVRSGRFGPPRFRLGHRVSELESRPDRLSNVPEAVGNAFARSGDLTLPFFDVASPAIQLFFGPYQPCLKHLDARHGNPSPESGRGSG